MMKVTLERAQEEIEGGTVMGRIGTKEVRREGGREKKEERSGRQASRSDPNRNTHFFK